MAIFTRQASLIGKISIRLLTLEVYEKRLVLSTIASLVTFLSECVNKPLYTHLVLSQSSS